MAAKNKKFTPLEIVIASLGMMIVLYVISFTVYNGITNKDKPVSVKISVQSIDSVKSGYLLKVKLKNDGDETAQGLVIEGDLEIDKNRTETSTVNLDYLPSHSTKEIGIFFKNNPKTHKFSIKPLGYETP